ncbi:quinol:cytochrome c oxidoreductase monoheme cytochrome subunit [Hydrobacter penzbergensis]|uniref:Quinol:cytochrome c oxidoreductase monoheme cytochrome subunit n=1 Tax=Hydrobacter penzbergensis TaxID=1235997 RepID=A0A8X8IBR4_9BACT|nr:cytochrome c [Hydrobacter penzbergensis]SDW76059.1 quinol:cytochrome c oxidoreductase monoheme cytochrome subunit [Hydrobacter penzbergensis]
MNKLSIIAVLSAATVIVSCSDVKRTPGHIYMPDMAYSRAYETYADHSNLAEKGINFDNRPVAGTIAREEEMPFPYAKDQGTDTTNYVASKQVKSPFDSLSTTDAKEAERLYQINCGICHGTKLDGNGPLYKGGEGPYPAAPKNFIGDPVVSVMPEGQMFYSVSYGKNMMGSYASQLTRKQRWMVIKYIKNKQLAAKAAAAAPAADATAKK